MKKATFGILFLCILLASSCKKSSSSSNSWTFENTTYTAITCQNLNGSLIASGTNGNLNVIFYSTAPTVSTSYTVGRDGAPASDTQIGITLINTSTNPASYSSTGGNGNQTIRVNVSSGKLSISASGIELRNNSDPADSAALSFNLSQTN